MRKRKLVCGVGVNDADYVVKKGVVTLLPTGKKTEKIVWFCPYHRRWADMLSRCYCEKLLKRKPTYVGCSVVEDWLLFSNFKRWVDEQPNRNWENCHLDKDVLCAGNKVYGPEACVFVTQDVNKFLVDRKLWRGVYLIGVGRNNKVNLFTASCSNPFTGRVQHLGYFEDELDAHRAWKQQKHEYACQLAELQDDPRVADALRQRYAPDKDWTKA